MSQKTSTRKTATKRQTPAPVVVEAPAPVVVEAPVVLEAPVVVEPVVELGNVTNLDTKFKDIIGSLTEYIKTIRSLENDLKTLKIEYQREFKELKKNKKRTRKNTGSNVPHGFVKEVGISNDLADFLGLPHGSKMARPQVTSAINKYVIAHELYYPPNKSIFDTDAALEKILGKPTDFAIKKKPELGIRFSYFNINRALKNMNHFLKDGETVSA